MTHAEIVAKLREAAKDPFYQSVFIVFALRERARHMLTIEGLDARMKKENFEYPREKYRELLKFLAIIGLGQLKTGHKGQAVAVDKIPYTLQSIGKAAVGADAATLERLKAGRHRFGTLAALPSTSLPPPAPTERPARQPRPYQTSASRVILTVLVNDRPVNIPVPRDFRSSDIAELVSRFQEEGREPPEVVNTTFPSGPPLPPLKKDT